MTCAQFAGFNGFEQFGPVEILGDTFRGIVLWWCVCVCSQLNNIAVPLVMSQYQFIIYYFRSRMCIVEFKGAEIIFVTCVLCMGI